MTEMERNMTQRERDSTERGSLREKTVIVTGASRGIGRSIALRFAKEGANVVVAAKSEVPHPTLAGTIGEVAHEVEAAGGRALPLVLDVRDENQIERVVAAAASHFGGIDVLVNNASAIHLAGTESTSAKRYDLLHQVNVRGTFLCSRACIPHLRRSGNPHILNLSPPIDLDPRWFAEHLAYTMTKYGMSMCVLGMARELAPMGIAVNALWPRTAIHTAALTLLGGDELTRHCRRPEIVADAAFSIVTRDAREHTGRFFLDEDVLREAGVRDFERYAVDPEAELLTDLFVDPDESVALSLSRS